MRKYRIIINADDLGMSKEVNSAIEKAIKEGCISSSTIMANAPAFEDAVRIAKLYPNVSFGLHLNIDEFNPLTDSSVFAKYGMMSENGSFKKEYLQNADINYSDELLKAIYSEWKTQMEKLLSAGITPSHLDSHEHTHGIFELQPLFLRLMKEYGIRRARRQPFSSMFEMIVVKLMHLNPSVQSVHTPQTETTPVTKNRSFVKRRLHQLLDAHRHRQWICNMRGESIVMTEFFDGYQKFCNCYPKLFKFKRIKTIELMTHPGHKGYFAETEMLMRKELQNVCKYELINYNQL